MSFEVEAGEALGIVGHNGAGKSTILKLLSRITAPTRGEIAIRGRLAALVELGAGFHPELTGRENINLSGSILGMSRAEIIQKTESIIAFAGLAEYIDFPVKKYSSGMYVRLGFSIAAHLGPDVLLLDEVLAVGDAAFQMKCLDLIQELRNAGRTIVLVSHDLAAVGRICDRAMLLKGGEIVMSGPPRKVIDEYMLMGFAAEEIPASASPTDKAAQCSGVNFVSGDDDPSIRTGYPMIARLAYRAFRSVENAVFRISLYWPSGYLCSELAAPNLNATLNLESGSGTIEFQCPVLALQPGLYRVDIAIESRGYVIDSRLRCSALHVSPGKMMSGDFYFEHTWRHMSQ